MRSLTVLFRSSRLNRRLSVVCISFACVCAVSCGESPVATNVEIASVEVTSTTNSLRAGTTLALSLKLLDNGGKVVENVPVVWSSSDETIATVSNAGVVTAASPGTVTIAASALGKSSTTKITVTDREVSSIQLSPAVTSVRVGTTTPLTATTLDANGNTLSRAVAWTTSDASIATVSNAGVVTGVAIGVATVTATSEGKTATAALTVTASPVATVSIVPASATIGVGAQVALTATLKDAAGVMLTGRNVSWNSNNALIATVSSTGVVTALAPGAIIISATSEGRTGTVAVVVLARLASTVTLTPTSATIVIGNTLQLSSQITDPAGNLLNNRPISFSSDNSAVAVVNAAGLVSALSEGTATITATSEGKVGTATVVVAPLPVASVNVTPATSNVFVGATVQLSAQALDVSGASITGRAVTWISGAPSIATVSNGGLLTAVSTGTALVLAVVDGVAGSATVNVSVRVITTLTVLPIEPLLSAGGSVQLTATARDGAGTILTGRPVIWSSADESIAFVSSSGLLIALKTGTTTITAKSEGVIGSTVVSVR
jgi:uncharacterized protein YjdB